MTSLLLPKGVGRIRQFSINFLVFIYSFAIECKVAFGGGDYSKMVHGFGREPGEGLAQVHNLDSTSTLCSGGVVLLIDNLL